MMVFKCPVCPMLFVPARRRRTYCSLKCQQLHYVLEGNRKFAEFLWIAGTDTWDNVAARLEFSSRLALEKWLERRGELEWMAKVHNPMPRVHPRAA